MANNAVVGVLRTLLTADTAQYEGGLRKATVLTANFGKEVQKLTPQAERMAKAFSGDRLLAQANNLAAAVNKVGGAAKLTESEQRRVNATLTEAIAKYRALGQTAPAAMLATEKATRQADTSTSKWGGTLRSLRGGLAAFGISLSVGSVVAFGKALLDMADTLVKVSDRTGLTTTEVQKLQFVAGQSGNSIEDMTAAIGQLQNRLIGKDGGAVKAVEFLKLNFDALKTASPFEQLAQIGKALAGIEDPAVRARVAVQLFGRAGLVILPTLIADFEKLGNEAPLMSEQTVKALDDAGDALAKFWLNFKVLAAEALNFSIQVFNSYQSFLQRWAADLSDTLAGLAERIASLPGTIPGVGFIAGPAAQIAAKLRADAAQLRSDATATEMALNTQEMAIKRNTGALIDYDALLNRAAESIKKVKEESTALLPLLREHFRWWTSLPPAIEDNKASLEAIGTVWTITLEEAAARAAELRTELDAITKAGMGPFDFGAFKDTKPAQEVAAEQEAAADEVREAWLQTFRDIGRGVTMSISDALAGMLTGLRSFKDGFLDIWRSIRQGFANILASMLDSFVESFLKGMLRALGGAKLGQSIANALIPGAGSALASAIPGGVLTGAAATGLTAGGTLASFGPSAGVLAAGTGVGGGGAAAGAGAGGAGGFLANPAFWTNPWTIAGIGSAALLTWGITKKGWFRGGAEGVQVNPRRDKFLGQFGGPGTDPGSGFGRLAAQLTKWSGVDGGGPLFRALTAADSMKEWGAAQGAIVGEYARHGMKIKSFAMGGFIPPGMTQLAVLHGGSRGEVVAPVSRMTPAGPTNIMHTHNYVIQAWDGADVKRVLEREVWPRFNRETILNQHGVASSIKRIPLR